MTYIITYRYMRMTAKTQSHSIWNDKEQAERWYNRYLQNGNYFCVTKNWE